MTPKTLRRLAQLRTHIAWLGDRDRLGWWATDALSVDAGGAILARIFPKTGSWAAVEVAWACARVVEARLIPEPSALTLFRLGPALDAEVRGWIRAQKQTIAPPSDLVPVPGDAADRAVREHVIASTAIDRAVFADVAERVAPPGAQAIDIGPLVGDLVDEPHVARLAEHLAAAYLHHAGHGHVVVPFCRAS